MAFSSDLTLDGRDGTEKTFTLLSQDSVGSRRIDSTTDNVEPTMLTIKHSTSGNGKSAVDRHLISASRTQMDSNDNPYTAVVNLTIALPRNAAIVATDAQDLMSYIVDLLTDGGFSSSGLAGTTNFAKFLRGES